MKDNSSLYYLGDVFEQLFEEMLEYKGYLERRESELDEGILVSHYIVIGKLFRAAKAMGLFRALPPSWQDATSTTLANDIEQGKYTFNHVLQLSNTFVRASEQLPHRPLNLQRVLEEIISEGISLKVNLQSEFDEGKLLGYNFCLATLLNQAFVFDLLKTLPVELQNFVPESLSNVSYKTT